MRTMDTNEKKKKLVTHDGPFHADDVFATAALSILLERKEENFEISRTRDEDIIREGDIVFDVGRIYDENRNRFDHHQKEGADARENGIPYSSFGLVWKKFGAELAGGKEIAERVDSRLIQQIDANDNGFDISAPLVDGVIPYGIYDVIFTFHPSYKDMDPDFDGQFMKAVNFARTLLEKEMEEAKEQEEIHQYISEAVEKTDSKILVLDEYVPREKIWTEMVDYTDFLFAVAPRNSRKDSWKVIVLPKQRGAFEYRKALPSGWAGLQNEELARETGVLDAVFAHRALFMAIAKSKEGAIRLAELALNN